MHVNSMEANYGGTEIRSALEYTLKSKTNQQVNGKPIPVAVFVLTDGETEDINNIVPIVSRAVATAERENGLLRVFSLGIGEGVSTSVCEGIARAGKGIAAYFSVSVPLGRTIDLL
jgi:von Willebrand factor type A domain